MVSRGFWYGLAFLLCVVVFANVRSRRPRQAVLLAASYALYLSWGVWFAAVLVTSTVMNFLMGEWLRRKPSGLVLATGIVLNLSLLSVFKYLPAAAVAVPFASLQRFSHLALPVGISFWTFQAMSYLFDPYRGDELDPSLFEFALYMAFFPVMISGPICRLPEMLPQFRSESAVSWSSIGRGLSRIATGVFMMALARLLGQGILAGDSINTGFDQVTRWSGGDVWCLALGYGLQLFFDFAGYSHIAIGAAQALGIMLPENFAHPFQSTSPSVFWTRWHMSLSFWIRDYVFFPLAIVRRETWWRNLALVVSMILFGVWHRASVLFLLWGGYHGVLLVLHRQVQQVQRKFNWTQPAALGTGIAWVVTMGSINLGWIFFRANSLTQARAMLASMFSPGGYLTHSLSGSLYLLVLGLAAGYAVAVLVSDALDRYSRVDESGADSAPGAVALIARWRWFWLSPLYAIALLFLLIVEFSHGASAAQFMYGNF
jgi:alginate O-acetyltransferase complex protein AlgI